MDPETIAKEVLDNKELLSEVIKRVSSREDAIRYQNFKVLAFLTERNPEIVYPYWDYFADLLSSDNSYLKFIGIQIIANLTRADTENRFENIFDKYYTGNLQLFD